MSENYQKLYNNRFDQNAKIRKDGTWIEVCRYIEHVFKEKIKGTVVDVAAGYCEFINNIHIHGSEKRYAIDLNPDISRYARDNVNTIVSGIGDIKSNFEKNSVDVFWMSNFLEHISKEDIRKLLQDEYALLKPGGIVLILTPNIRYVGGKYWDFFDHITPITEMCIIEEAETIGFRKGKVIKKFLPFTTKSCLPQAQWIVRLYCMLMPFSGMFFGEQSLIELIK